MFQKHFFQIKKGDVFYDKRGYLVVAVEDAASPSDCLFVTSPDLFIRSKGNQEIDDDYAGAYFTNMDGVGESVDIQYNLLACVQ